MASMSEIRKQLDEVKASIRAFTDGIQDVVQFNLLQSGDDRVQ